MTRRWLLCVTVLAGCALIDAAQGDKGEDDDFESHVCGWLQCGCALTGCDPFSSCEQYTPCRTCLSDIHCDFDDTCLPGGYCSGCHDLLFWNSGPYTVGGVDYYCEYDAAVINPACIVQVCAQ